MEFSLPLPLVCVESSQVSQQWCTFYTRFNEYVNTSTPSSSFTHPSSVSLLLFSSVSWLENIQTMAQDEGIDFTNFVKLLGFVEKTCLLNFLVLFERFRFFTKSQDDTETVDDFVRSLYSQAELCMFDQSLKQKFLNDALSQHVPSTVCKTGVDKLKNSLIVPKIENSDDESVSCELVDLNLSEERRDSFKPVSRKRQRTSDNSTCHISRSRSKNRNPRKSVSEAEDEKESLQPNRAKIRKTNAVRSQNFSSTNRYMCYSCGSQFKLLTSLQSHISRKHADHRHRVCRYCGKYFDDVGECKLHVQRHILKNRKRSEGTRPSKAIVVANSPTREPGVEHCCGLCMDVFRKLTSLQSHILRKHYYQRQLLCRWCGKYFADSEDCKVHVNEHITQNKSRKHDSPTQELQEVDRSKDSDLSENKSASPRIYSCDCCSKQFSTISGLRSHRLNKHSDESRMLCGYCAEYFDNQEDYKKHVTLHRITTEDVRYHCQLCNCGFGVVSSLKAHILRKHKDIKEHICRCCGEYFDNIEDRVEHDVTAHGVWSRSKPIGEKLTPVVNESSVEATAKTFDLNSVDSSPSRNNLDIHKRSSESRIDSILKTDGGVRSDVQSVFDAILKTDVSVKCAVCGNDFQVVSSLHRHILVKHEDLKDVMCHRCGRLFDNVDSCKIHSLAHYNEKQRDPDEEVEHNLQKDGLNLQPSNNSQNQEISSLVKSQCLIQKSARPFFKCHLCGEYFRVRKTMQCHIRKCHQEVKFQLCRRCGMYFNTVEECVLHEREHENAKRLPCNFCTKLFRGQEALDKHVKWHLKQKDHQCDICGNFYLDKKALNAHRQRHLDKEPSRRTFQCILCNKWLSSAKKMEYHLKIHTDDRPFICEICGASYRHKMTLRNHLLGHEGKMPFECKICGKRTRTSTDMQKHMPIHSDKKMYTCKLCGKSYRYETGLYQHKRINHQGRRPYVCTICGCTYTTLNCLRNHKKTHTNPNIKTRPTKVPKVIVPNVENSLLANEGHHVKFTPVVSDTVYTPDTPDLMHAENATTFLSVQVASDQAMLLDPSTQGNKYPAIHPNSGPNYSYGKWQNYTSRY